MADFTKRARVVRKALGGMMIRLGKGRYVDLPEPGQLVSGNVGLINWKASNTRRIAASLLAAIAGTSRSRWVMAADSTFAGTNALNTGTVNAKAKAWTTQLQPLLRALGANAYSNWAIGSGFSGSDIAGLLQYDPRIQFGSSVSLSSSFQSVAGQSWGTGADAVNGWFQVTPQESFDTVDVLHGFASALGTYEMFDAGLVKQGASVNTSVGGQGVRETTTQFAPGSTSARLKTTGTNVRIAGMGFRDSARPGIEIIECSISGAQTTFFTSATSNDWMAHRASLPVLFRNDTHNVYWMGGGANDVNSGATLAQMQDRMRSRIEHLLSLPNVPDIVSVNSPPARLDVYTVAQRQALNDARLAVAMEYDIPTLDIYALLPDWDTMTELGLGSTDGRHLAAPGLSAVAALAVRGVQHSASLISP